MIAKKIKNCWKKTPNWATKRWNRYVIRALDKGMPYASFNEFTEFVEEEIRLAYNPISSLQVLKQTEKSSEEIQKRLKTIALASSWSTPKERHLKIEEGHEVPKLKRCPDFMADEEPLLQTKSLHIQMRKISDCRSTRKGGLFSPTICVLVDSGSAISQKIIRERSAAIFANRFILHHFTRNNLRPKGAETTKRKRRFPLLCTAREQTTAKSYVYDYTGMAVLCKGRKPRNIGECLIGYSE